MLEQLCDPLPLVTFNPFIQDVVLYVLPAISVPVALHLFGSNP